MAGLNVAGLRRNIKNLAHNYSDAQVSFLFYRFFVERNLKLFIYRLWELRPNFSFLIITEGFHFFIIQNFPKLYYYPIYLKKMRQEKLGKTKKIKIIVSMSLNSNRILNKT